MGGEIPEMDNQEVLRRFKAIGARAQFDRIEEAALRELESEDASPAAMDDKKRPLPDEVDWGSPKAEHGDGVL